MTKIPTAHISVQKNRQKQHKTTEDDNTYYLNDKQTFEIELFNPLTETIAAEININGKRISDSKLLIKPGQRIWLERFIDKNAKFIFETYNVSGKDSNVKEAIANNGNININFFKEKVKQNIYPVVTYPYYNPWRDGYNPWGTNFPIYYGGTSYTTNVGTSTPTFDGISTGISSGIKLKTKSLKRSLSKENQIETGRVEQGSASCQSLRSVDIELDTFSFHSIQIKLKPLSERFLTDKDIKRHCSECGLRIRNKKWKHCTACGTKL